ncbi:hypothetical protein PIB30_020116 [Stylosanthes scabra]|uniref:Uncharacterized protein n=1 Tax=Stylosanthes scabra TaxID=79078 RepID=A0ABU6X5W6_9FABA|nr:hypothetical protein [Stylosanthes scabra]
MDSQRSRGSRSSKSTMSTQRRMLVQEHCDFFLWANQELPEEDAKKAKLRKKVLSLKSKMKTCEWRLKIAAFIGILG